MFKLRSTSRVLFWLVACVLFCTIATAEIPELVTFRNNTSNDFTLRERASAESARALKTAKENAIQVTTTMEDRTADLPSKVEGTLPQVDDPPLFILNSVLRR